MPRAYSSSCCPPRGSLHCLARRTGGGSDAIGTNDVAAHGQPSAYRATQGRCVRARRSYFGLVAVVTHGIRVGAPDAGITGNGMALPAITIAVLAGGVAIGEASAEVSAGSGARYSADWRLNAGIRRWRLKATPRA